ncbi:MAG: nicotinate phosphoribosyltransferase [Bacilli bacterium]|nr:nicotinate phosphoribosyltransferase [Bacilli bacterium]
MRNNTLMTDFYELTMAQTYFHDGKENEQVYFDLFFRKNPFDGGYTIAGGLDNIIQYIKNFKFTNKEIQFLRSLGNFCEEFLQYLKNLKFDGDIYAVPDGTPVFPNEPAVTIKANIIVASIIETALLTDFNHGSLVMTAAKRIVHAAKDKPVMEFGARRARGVESAIGASKYAYIAGCVGTSNTKAGMDYGVPLMGTMAHSLVTESKSEYDAFLSYAKANPNNAIFLVDTYDTLKSGIPNAIKVAKDFLIPNGYPFKGIRIDSGDLAYLSKMARKMLDDASFKDTKICISSDLDEYTITSLIEQGTPFDTIGAGNNIAAAKERVGGVYKLVAVEEDDQIVPRIKISNDAIKTINPGYKKVYRFYDKDTGYALGDVIALSDEIIDKEKYTLVHPEQKYKKQELSNYEVHELQVPIFKNGKQVYRQPNIHKRRDFSKEQFDTLYPEIQRVTNPHEYYVDLSEKLSSLKQELIEFYKVEEVDPPKVKVK